MPDYKCTRNQNTIYIDSLSSYKSASHFIYCLKEAINQGYQDIILDFEKVDISFPNAVVPISGLIDYYSSTKNIDFVRIDSNKIISSSNLLDPLIVNNNIDLLSYNSLNKVWKFQSYDEVYQLVKYYVEQLIQTDYFEEGVMSGIEWALNEVMDNVIQHSKTEFGYIMCQIHNNTKHIAICIFDPGQGIFNSLKDSIFHPKSALDALTLAVKEGVTRDKKVGQGNGMYGLHEIVKNNLGTLTITSSSASYMLDSNKISSYEKVPVISFSEGTTAIDFQLDYKNKISLTDALKFEGKSYNFVNYHLNSLENETGEIEVKMLEKTGGYGTRKSGERIRMEIMNLFNESHKPISLDFRGVGIISSSYADELIGKLVIEFGFFGFNNIIRLKNMNELVQSILQRSVSQRMAESLNKDNH